MSLGPALIALAWTLIHSLWQALVIAAVVALLSRRCARAELRYALYFGGVVATLAASIVTYLLVYPWTVPWTVGVGVGEAALMTALAAEGGAGVSLGSGAGLASLGVAGERWLAGLLLAWSAGASLMAARMLLGLAAIGRLRRSSVALGGRWSELLERLRGELGVRRPVGLAHSRAIDSPLVVGALRPLILLPIGMVNRLSAASVEAALLHELVHVRRHDYLMGLALALVESLLFFHPAIWWMSRRAREEREHCCDDGVVHHTGDPLRYALALTDLEALRGQLVAPRPPTLGQAAAGGDLMSRIQRIIQHCDPASSKSTASTSSPASPVPAASMARTRRSPSLWMPVATLAAALAVTAAVVPACMEEDDVAAELPREAAGEAIKGESAEVLAVDSSDAVEPADRGDTPKTDEGLSIAWCERLAPFAPEIRAAAERHGVDPELVAIVTLLESDGDPSARSSHGARGLMQLMPQTAATIAERRGLAHHSEDRLDDPAYNLDLGAYHLAELLEGFAPGETELSAESVELVAAAYNGGAPRVRAYLAGDAELSAETARYKQLVRDLWSERDEPASATLDGLRTR